MADIVIQPRGPAGANGLNFYTETRNPIQSDGRDNETWLNTRSLTMFKKVQGTWASTASLAPPAPKPGTPGMPGKTIYSDEGPPSAQLGTSGDFYVQKMGGVGLYIYGPKAGAVWPDPVALVTLLVGNAPPVDNYGVDGQVYIDVVGLKLYGPKLNDEWPAGVPIVGTPGAPGQNAGMRYVWSSGTSGDPGLGKVRVNNTTFALVTSVAISETDADGGGVAALLASWSSSTNSVKGTIRIVNQAAAANFMEFAVVGLVTDAGAYQAVSVAPIAQGGAFLADDNLSVHFTRSGDAGTNGTGTGNVNTIGPAVAGRVPIYADGTGNSLQDSGLTLAFATKADVWAGSSNKVVTAQALKEAQEPQPLTMGATVTPDFNAGVNFYGTLNANTNIAAPANPKAGWSGTIELTTASTAFSLVFATFWKFRSAGSPTPSASAGQKLLISYVVNAAATEATCAVVKDA